MWHLFVNRVCGNIGGDDDGGGNHHYVCEDDGDIVVGGDNNNDDDEVLTWPLSSSLCLVFGHFGLWSSFFLPNTSSSAEMSLILRTECAVKSVSSPRQIFFFFTSPFPFQMNKSDVLSRYESLSDT